MSKPKSAKRLAVWMIVNALFWAAVILAGAYLFRGREWAEQIPIIGAGGWVIVNGWLAAKVSRLND